MRRTAGVVLKEFATRAYIVAIVVDVDVWMQRLVLTA